MAEQVVDQGHGFTCLIKEMEDSIRADPSFRESTRRRLLTKRGSGPDGQLLENTFCSNWSPHLACLRRASLACPHCNLARYCSLVCLQEHQKRHRELCGKTLMSHSDEYTSVIGVQECQSNLPTLSNPPFPVYGLLRDLQPLEHCFSSTPLTPSSSMTCASSTSALLEVSTSVTTSSSTAASVMTPLSSSSSSSASPALTASLLFTGPPVPPSLPNHLRFFFPSAYDLRNVLQTACQIPEDYRGHVTFFINSAKSILAVRDLLILELLRCYNSEGIDAAIALWYSSALTTTQNNMAYLATHRILRSKAHVDNGHDITCYGASFFATCTGSSLQADFGTDATRLLLSISDEKTCKYEPKEQYCRPEEESCKEKCAMPPHFASWSRYQTEGLTLPFGACDTSFQKPNLLRYSSSLNFIARYSEDVLCGWDIPELIRSGAKHAASNLDLYGCLFFHVHDLMQMFLCRVKSCCIELRLTQLRPRTLADIMYDADMRFHRIDGCGFANDKANPGYYLKLQETVNLFGKLLEKDVSPAWPSLLLTSTSDWGEEATTVNRKLNGPDRKPATHTALSNSLETSVHDGDYESATKMLQMNLPPSVLNHYFNDLYADYFSPSLLSLKVDEEAEKLGLQRQHRHRIVSPCCCLPLGCISDNTSSGAMNERFYFHVLFSGFTFLERFLEWGWNPTACLQLPKHGLNPGENEAHLQMVFEGELNALGEESEFAEMLGKEINRWSSISIADEPWHPSVGAFTDLMGSDTHLQASCKFGINGPVKKSSLVDSFNENPKPWDSLDDADYEWDLSDETMNCLDAVDAASNQWGPIDEALGEPSAVRENDTSTIDRSNNAGEDEQASGVLELDVPGPNMIAAAKEDQYATDSTCDSATEQLVADTLAGIISGIESQAHTTANENSVSASGTEVLGLGDLDSSEAVADLIKAIVLSLPLAEILGAHQEVQVTAKVEDKEESVESQGR